MVKQASFDPLDIICQGWVVLSLGVDLSDGVHDRGVVPASEIATDLLEAVAGVSSCQPHAHLPRQGDGFVPSLGQQIGQLDVVVPGDGIDDGLDGGLTTADPLIASIIRKCVLGQFKGDWLAGCHGKATNPGQRTLKLTDVRIDLRSDVGGYVLWQIESLDLRL